MDAPTNDYPELKSSMEILSGQLIETIRSRWTADWSRQPPRVGSHYTLWDVEALPSYEAAKAELAKVPFIGDKFDEMSLDKPITAFLELTVQSLPDPSFLQRAIDYWWAPFVALLQSTRVPIRLYVGLTNFKSTNPQYRLDSETAVCYYGDRSLASELSSSVGAPLERFPSPGVPLHLIRGAIQVDFSCPADTSTLVYGNYSHECIDRKIPLENALRLSAFGRLVVGPWIPVCNPSFPVDGVRAISSPDKGSLDEPIFELDDAAWERFKVIHRHLRELQRAEEADPEKDRGVRRRFESAISRFVGTFDQGYWESVVVDLVILMESLLTPNRHGGGMQIALAASNLLGDNPVAAREIFDNVAAMYKIRNQSVHGEPATQETWYNRILAIAGNAGIATSSLDYGAREYAFEVMRDYARRTIVGTLNLYCGAGRGPSDELTADLHRMHLDKRLADTIRAQARTYPLAERPSLRVAGEHN